MKRARLYVITGAVAGFGGVLGAHALTARPAPALAPAAAPSTGASPGPSASPSTSTGATAARTVTGPVENFGFGSISVRVTVHGSRIVAVSTAVFDPLEPTSRQISVQALPALRAEVLSAQSARIDGVSGATYTSQGYAKSLQAALDELHIG